VATGATILAGGKILGSLSAPGTATNPVFKIGGDLEVNRLGFGAMRLTGEGIWGWPPDRANAVKVLKRAVELLQDASPTPSKAHVLSTVSRFQRRKGVLPANVQPQG